MARNAGVHRRRQTIGTVVGKLDAVLEGVTGRYTQDGPEDLFAENAMRPVNVGEDRRLHEGAMRQIALNGTLSA
jgi:hypothetical protein